MGLAGVRETSGTGGGCGDFILSASESSPGYRISQGRDGYVFGEAILIVGEQVSRWIGLSVVEEGREDE